MVTKTSLFLETHKFYRTKIITFASKLYAKHFNFYCKAIK